MTVVIGTFGDPYWVTMAHARAIPSATALGVPVIYEHAHTLHDARNQGLKQVQTEWVIHLDADDELEPGYLTAMATGTADVRGPLARYVQPDGRERLWQPRVWGHDHDCTTDCLPEGNWLLIGSVVRTDLLRAAGGWRDFPWSEDWDTWLRCRAQGATFELIPAAIYRAHVRPDSRNRGATRAAKLAAHQAIHRANFPELHHDAA